MCCNFNSKHGNFELLPKLYQIHTVLNNYLIRYILTEIGLKIVQLINSIIKGHPFNYIRWQARGAREGEGSPKCQRY